MRLHRIFIALTLASSMFACSHALEKVKVTTQPANQPLVLDLSNDGTIYDVAGDVDYDRVLIRTAPGEMLHQSHAEANQYAAWRSVTWDVG